MGRVLEGEVGLARGRRSRRLVERRGVKRAGESARRKHEKLAKNWRERNKYRLLVLFAISVGLYFWSASMTPNKIAFALTLTAGFFLTICLVFLEDTVAPIENWRSGADGEVLTARQLRNLKGSEWYVAHDLHRPGTSEANIDHVVVAGSTIFLLETKHWSGRLFVEGARLKKRTVDDLEQPVYDVNPREETSWSKSALERHFRESVRLHADVCPVLVVWTKFDERRFERDGVVVVHGDELEAFLREKATDLHPVPDRIKRALQELEIEP